MKKIHSAIILVLLLSTFLSGCNFKKNNAATENDSKFSWLPSESYFVEYDIIGDKVIFKYSICFVNDWDEDYAVNVSAKFKKSMAREII